MKDRQWDDREGLTHLVPFTIGDSYSVCGIRIAWAPGQWTERSVTCMACVAGHGVVEPNVVRPPLERVAGYWPFRWPFRTTGGMIHGVPSTTQDKLGDLRTFCGVSTQAKLVKGTGRWVHGNEVMTCIGCLAASRAS